MNGPEETSWGVSDCWSEYHPVRKSSAEFVMPEARALPDPATMEAAASAETARDDRTMDERMKIGLILSPVRWRNPLQYTGE